MQTSKVSNAVRKAIVPAIAAYATTSGIAFNVVSGAVLFGAEKLEVVNQATVEALITQEQIQVYQEELCRRYCAHATQLVGMVRNALPKAQRTEENVITILGRLPAHASIARLRTLIKVEVAEMNPTPMFEGFAHTRNAV